MRRLETSLHWLREYVENVRARRAARRKTYEATVDEKVDWLCKMCQEAKPTRGKKLQVPLTLLPEGAPATEFDAESFLRHCLNNFLDDEQVHTRLSLEQMRRLETSLPWLREYVENVRARRAARRKTYEATVDEKVDW